MKGDNIVGYWLIASSILILIMVMVGGTTRLTGSGLSIVEWDVIMGTIPPLNDANWNKAFEQYKQFPQFQLENFSMLLSDFKAIYWWEYIHRLLGRFIGLFLIVQFIFFWVTRRLSSLDLKKYIISILLVGVVGAWGWFMVTSGLAEKPSVDPYRLTIHLLLALSLLTFIFWFSLSHLNIRSSNYTIPLKLKRLVVITLVLVLFQLIYGGFMSGLKAAVSFPTYPLMDGKLLPENLLELKPVWKNFFENDAFVQLIHRVLPISIGIAIITIYFYLRRFDGMLEYLGNAAFLLMAVFIIQFVLGIITLVNSIEHVPVVPGVLHQGTGVVLYLIVIYLLFKTRIKYA